MVDMPADLFTVTPIDVRDPVIMTLPLTSSVEFALDFDMATVVPLSYIEPVESAVAPMNLVT